MTGKPNGGWPHFTSVPGSTISATIFDQFEAIVDSTGLTAEQKCLTIKFRCRVDGKTLTGALVSNAGLMQAASISDWRTLRAELCELEGKSRTIPKDENGNLIEDPIDKGRALIAREERSGKATSFAITPERLNAIINAYLVHRQQNRSAAGKPPAHHAPPAPDGPPARHAPNPLHAMQGDPLHAMQTDPFPSSIDPNKRGADAPASELPLAEIAKPSPARRTPAKPKATEDQFERFWIAYPKREGRAAARKNFLALTWDDAELAIAGAEAYARKCRSEGKDPKFIKWPQGWLSERRFEDYADQPSANGSAASSLPPPYWWRHNPAAAASFDADQWQQLIDACGEPWNEAMLGPPPGAPGCVIRDEIIAKLKPPAAAFVAKWRQG